MAKTIDFESSSAVISLPPKLGEISDIFVEQLNHFSKDFDDSILIATSGTTALAPKIVVLSKYGFRTACETVNHFIQASSNDKWLLAIPHYHIGGLSILYRAFLSNSLVDIFNGKWCPFKFATQLEEQSISFSSIVPTQLYDLVLNKIYAPKHLKKILVGGGNLHPQVYLDAVKLGWPIVSTFGMTESSAMFAYCQNAENEFTCLPHVQVKSNEDQMLMIKGTSILSGYITFENKTFNFVDPKIDGWYKTDDVICANQEKFTPKGRINRVIKINGNLVFLDQIQNLIAESFHQHSTNMAEVYVTSVPNIRSENSVVLVTNNKQLTLTWVHSILADKIPKYALPSNVHFLDTLPKTDMGKIIESEIKKAVAVNAI